MIKEGDPASTSETDTVIFNGVSSGVVNDGPPVTDN